MKQLIILLLISISILIASNLIHYTFGFGDEYSIIIMVFFLVSALGATFALESILKRKQIISVKNKAFWPISFIIIFGIPFLISSSMRFDRNEELMQGETMQGLATVNNVYKSSGRSEHRWMYVYQYSVNGKIYTGEGILKYHDVKVGDSFEVIISKEDFSIHRIDKFFKANKQ